MSTPSIGLDFGMTSTASPSIFQYTLNNTNLEWNTWTPWSECSQSCEGGQRLRLMLCDEVTSASNCSFVLRDDGNISLSYELDWSGCNPQQCPVHGSWNPWGLWSGCSATCDTGTRRRDRSCDGPLYGGRPCPSSENKYEVDFCLNHTCTKAEEEQRMTFKEEQELIAFKESDKRTSAINTGVISMVFVLVEVFLILAFDATTFYRQAAFGYKNLKHFGRNVNKAYKRYRKGRVESKPDVMKKYDSDDLSQSSNVTQVDSLLEIDKDDKIIDL